MREELEAERVENSENMGVIDNLLIEDEPEAPSTGEKRTITLKKTFKVYLKECLCSVRSESNEDIDISLEEQKEKCIEDFATRARIGSMQHRTTYLLFVSVLC